MVITNSYQWQSSDELNVNIIFLGDQEMIIPEWLFELPKIESERKEI